MRLRTALAGLIAAAFVAGCDGSNTTVAPFTPSATPTPAATATPTPAPTATPTPAPTATPTAAPPTPAPLSLSTASVSLTAAGQSATFSVSESGYGGALTAANGTPSCSGIATFSPAGASGPSATFTVTAVAAGQCTIVVSDTHGQSISETVYVTTTTGTVN